MIAVAMRPLPAAVARFLEGKRYAVAGVSRGGRSPANAILRRLREGGREVFAINPNATELEGGPCYPDLGSIPGGAIHGVVIATHPSVAPEIVRQCIAGGVRHVWFHRSFGPGSFSGEAVRACREAGIEVLEGGCPMMYCEPVDMGHRCIRWFLTWRGKLPR